MLFRNFFFVFKEKVLGWGGDFVQIVDALHLVNMGKLSQDGRNMERLS